jgi:hypothetical protein
MSDGVAPGSGPRRARLPYAQPKRSHELQATAATKLAAATCGDMRKIAEGNAEGGEGGGEAAAPSSMRGGCERGYCWEEFTGV